MNEICEIGKEFMMNIKDDIKDIHNKIDKNEEKNEKRDEKILEKLDDVIKLKIEVKYMKKNIEEHKSNSIVHINKWYIVATVLGSIIVGIYKIL